jgi:hypothetical protein
VGNASGDSSLALRIVVASHAPEGGLGTLNYGRYSKPALDALIARTVSEPDDARREALLREAVAAAIADVALIPLHIQKNIWVTRRGVAYFEHGPHRRLVAPRRRVEVVVEEVQRPQEAPDAIRVGERALGRGEVVPHRRQEGALAVGAEAGGLDLALELLGVRRTARLAEDDAPLAEGAVGRRAGHDGDRVQVGSKLPGLWKSDQAARSASPNSLSDSGSHIRDRMGDALGVKR